MQGLWHRLPLSQLGLIALVDFLLLVCVLLITAYGSRMAGVPLRDEIAIVFCGSKKTLASGVPMANVLFPASSVGLIVLPLMIYHQIQLFVCAVLARKFARMTQESAERLPAAGEPQKE